MIDWDVSRELYKDIGSIKFAEILTAFQEEAAERVRDLNSPGRDMGYDLHMLKSVSLNMGFTEWAKLCDAGEDAVSSATYPVNLDDIRTCFDASNRAFTAGFDLQAAS